MSDRYVEGADLVLEIETGDSTLSSHSLKKIWYVPPTVDGSRGDIADKLSTNGTAVLGTNGLSVNQSLPVTLIPGEYVFWSTSTNAAGLHCVSPAFAVEVERAGTIRR